MAKLPPSLRPSDPEACQPPGNQTDLLAELDRQYKKFEAEMAFRKRLGERTADLEMLSAMTARSIAEVSSAERDMAAREKRFEAFSQKHRPPTMEREAYLQNLRETRALALEKKQYEDLLQSGLRMTAAGDYMDKAFFAGLLDRLKKRERELRARMATAADIGEMMKAAQVIRDEINSLEACLRTGIRWVALSKDSLQWAVKQLTRVGRGNIARALAKSLPKNNRPQKHSAQAVSDRLRHLANETLKHPHRRRRTENVAEFHRILIDDFYDDILPELKGDRPSARMSKRSAARVPT